MTNEEFIEIAKQTLKKQQAGINQAQQQKAHEAEVIKTQGPKKWDALNSEILSLLLKIGDGIQHNSDGVNTNMLNTNTKNQLTITFDKGHAAIRYTGVGGAGGFIPTISGDDLIYKFDSEKYRGANTLGFNPAAEVPIQTMAQAFVARVVGMPI